MAIEFKREQGIRLLACLICVQNDVTEHSDIYKIHQDVLLLSFHLGEMSSHIVENCGLDELDISDAYDMSLTLKPEDALTNLLTAGL